MITVIYESIYSRTNVLNVMQHVHGFKGKFVYFLRTIPNINDHLQPIEEVIRNNLIPAITGGHQCSDEERKLLALPVRLGGLGIDDICKISTHEYESSRKVTKNLVDRVIKQEPKIKLHDEATKEVKNEIKKIRNDLYQQQLNEIKESLDESQKRQNEIIREPGCSAWLVTLPIGEYNYNLTKQEFWDAIRLRYNWPIPNLPSRCVCGEKFDVQHSMSCKKGGFITHRHNELRDITAKLLEEVCKDVEIEPTLTTLTGEEFVYKTANHQPEARLDVSANGFWIKGQRTFVDIRVYDPNALRYKNQTLKQCNTKNEMEKKRHYNERILQVEQGNFSPLVFTINGSMGTECRAFYSRLAELISIKRKLTNKSMVSSWLRTKVNFALLRSMLLRLRGSRSIRKRSFVLENIEIAEKISKR